MRLVKEFEVGSPRERVASLLRDEATLTGLFPNTDTEVVERDGSRTTTRTRYRALGREGEATFHFTFRDDGNLGFEKVCDGRVWRELRGEVRLEASDGGTRVSVSMEGATKSFVPEFTIKGPMQEQLDEMAAALRGRVEGGS